MNGSMEEYFRNRVDDYYTKLDRENKKIREFDLMMLKKYRGNHDDGKTICVIIPSLDGMGGASIPIEIYKKEEREFFKDYPDLISKW